MTHSQTIASRPAAAILLTAMLFHQFAFALSAQDNKVIIAIVDFKNTGARTDGGNDDDAADDGDIYLNWRFTASFNGESPNQYWGIYIIDDLVGDTGVLDYFQLEIYYSSASLLKQATPVTGKSTLAFNRGAGWTISSQSEDNRPVATASGAVEIGQTRLPTGSGRTGAKQ
ncbi:MAG: hypothetical protein IIA59_11750 [Candidatus Marinimicrobia bacterium]|nr:hypothetical protein [Candidatus Neomarinimicrobiota bacterium]